MSAEENKAALRRLIDEILNGGDLDAIDELVHEDYVDGYGAAPGRAGYRELVQATRRAFPDIEVAVEDLVAENDRVVGRFTIRGTHAGEFIGIPATGRRIEFAGMGMIRFRDGQMAERWNVSDIRGALEQIRAD